MLGIREYAGVEVIQGPSCHEPGCRGYGSTKSGVLFIGIAPGKDEIKTGRPLTGPSGKVLDHLLSSLGYDRKEVYCTNLICWFKDDPSEEEAYKCRARLDREISEIKPKLIILLGKIVAEIFTGRSFGKVRGAVQWNERYNAYVLATYHPAAILHAVNESSSGKDDKASIMVYDVARDFRKIKDVLTWEPGAPQAKVDYTVVRAPGEAQKVLDNLPRGYEWPVALDVETTYEKDDEEVEVFVDELLCVGVGTVEHSWVFMPSALYDEDGKPCLVWPDVWWVMQFAQFDTQVMKLKLDVWIDVKEDTLLQSYSLDERSGIHRLKTQAREYLAAGFYEEDRFFGKKKLNEIPESLLCEYNAKDTAYTARLCVKYRPWQEEEGVRGFYERILIPAVNMFKEIQFNGVQMDRELHRKLGLMWGNRFLEMEELLRDEAEQLGWDGRIDLGSTQQLGKFLFRVLSLPIVKRTKKGAPSTDKDVIKALKSQHPFVAKVEEFRHLGKMFSTYIAGPMRYLDKDFKAHPVVKLHGSRTGRPSYTKPPVQTIPVPFSGDEFSVLRQLFIAKEKDDKEEYVIFEADLGKAEIWMAYNESGDEQMYSDLTSGDYHTTVAMDVMHKEKHEVTKQDRVDMKRVTFGIMYDREAPSLSEAIKTSIVTAQEYINAFFKRNKKYATWFKDTQNKVRETGELVTKTGRKRRIIIVSSAVRALKQAVNYPIQATVSDVILDAAIEIHQKIKELDGRILFTVHDSIVCRGPKSRQKEIVTLLHDTMTAQRFEGVVRIPVEIKVGKNWGECQVVHECGVEGLDEYGRTQKCLW